jgi:putative ATPase
VVSVKHTFSYDPIEMGKAVGAPFGLLRLDESLYYDMLSAFCKSLRGSDSDAALAWFARLTYAGVDPRIIVRRIIAHASEDVGLANPNAMLTAVSAMRALEAIGMPEAKLPIGQAIITVCESPKSNSVVVAVDKAFANAEKMPFLWRQTKNF